jgi:hypothetical protein
MGALEIIYTNPGETADEYILKSLKDLTKPSQCTVVTSDKILANQCRLRLAQTMPIDEFLLWIKKRRKNIAAAKKEPVKVVLRPLIAPPKPPEPTPKPESKKEREHTLEDYEQIFSQSLQVAETEVYAKRTARKILKGKKKPPEKKSDAEKIESDMARWLDAFEKGEGK